MGVYTVSLVGFIVLGLDYFSGDRFETLMKQPGFVRTIWRDKVVAQADGCTPRWVEAVKQRYGEIPIPHLLHRMADVHGSMT